MRIKDARRLLLGKLDSTDARIILRLATGLDDIHQITEGESELAPEAEAVIQELMEKSIAFKNEINATLETARDKMLEPLTAELNDAISRVALKYSLDYVVNTEEKNYLYINPMSGIDITGEVETELGIARPTETPAAVPATTENAQ